MLQNAGRQGERALGGKNSDTLLLKDRSKLLSPNVILFWYSFREREDGKENKDGKKGVGYLFRKLNAQETTITTNNPLVPR